MNEVWYNINWNMLYIFVCNDFYEVQVSNKGKLIQIDFGNFKNIQNWHIILK